jgi:hypothetical protein
VELVYLSLPSVQLSVQRVAERVVHGGHNVSLPFCSVAFPVAFGFCSIPTLLLWTKQSAI